MELLIKKINFNNKNYYIANCVNKKNNRKVSLKIECDFLNSGYTVSCLEYETESNKFGDTIIAKKFLITEENEQQWAENFLLENISGIGKKTLESIIYQYPDNLSDILRTKPEKLIKIRGVNRKTIEQIEEHLEKEIIKENTVKNLINFEIPRGYARKIVEEFGDSSLDIIEKDPYALINRIPDTTHHFCENLFQKYSDKNYENKVFNLINHLIIKEYDRGHTAVFEDYLFSNHSYFGVSKEELKQFYEDIIKKKKLFSIKGKVTNLKNYEISVQIANKISELRKSKTNFKFKKITVPHFFNKEQEEAVNKALTEKISIITGGAGTGKTTTLKCILDNIKRKGHSFLMCAPTAMAAKRMKKATEEDSKTIHKLLEYNKVTNTFNVNKFNKLEADFIIVDESSMNSETIFNDLISSIPHNSHFIILGDYRQLPSVEAGQILKDLIFSEKIPTTKLITVNRTKKGSSIPEVANDILEFKVPKINNNKDDDIFLFEHTGERANEFIKFLIKDKIKQSFGYNPKTELQILSPVKKGTNGIFAINEIVQSVFFNEDKDPFIERNNSKFFLNDNVIQIVNNKEKMVFNGEQGVIEDIDINEVTVLFDDSEVEYKGSEMNEIMLSYAKTVHKSQGSEYKIVIFVLPEGYDFMIYNELIYTAITRGIDKVIIIGKEETLAKGILNRGAERITILKELLER